MIQIYRKGQPTKYPMYDNEEQAKKAMLEAGCTEDDFTQTWTSPRGVEPVIVFREVKTYKVTTTCTATTEYTILATSPYEAEAKYFNGEWYEEEITDYQDENLDTVTEVKS